MRARPSRVRRLRIRKSVENATLALVVLIVGSAYLALQKHVTLVVDGRPESVRTMSGSVGELLHSEGIVLDGGVVVEPPAATPLADGMTVVVDTEGFAAPVLRAPSDVGVWVVEGVSGPLLRVAVPPTENWFSAGDAVGSPRVVDARVVVKGKAHDVLTNATTVRGLLSAMGIEPDRSDRVHPSPRTPLHAGELVRFVDVSFRTREVRVPIPFTTTTTTSRELSPGEIKIVRSGRDGEMLETYRVKLVDGEVVKRTLLFQRVAEAPVAEQRLVGPPDPPIASGTEAGDASWYYAPGNGFTAAHPWLPFGTVVTVTNVANGKSVQVVINDRGPFGGRIIDLSPEAFSAIAPLSQGICRVRLSW
jgi:rare lipoprotein A